MKAAIEEAKKSKLADEWAGGAVIVRDGQVIVKAQNLVKRSNDPTAHAEIVAIRDFTSKLNSNNFQKTSLYTNAEPCPMCMAACIWAGIEAVYYGITLNELMKFGDYQIKIDSKTIARESFRAIKVRGGILKADCKKIFVK